MPDIRTKRMMEDYMQLVDDYKSSELVKIQPYDGESIERLKITLYGRKGTPYEGGKFKLDLMVGSNYPFEPPYVRFESWIWHPNIIADPAANPGRSNICLDLINPNKISSDTGWSASKTLTDVIDTLVMMLSFELSDVVKGSSLINFKSPLNHTAAGEWSKDPKKFVEHAVQMTREKAKEEW